MSVLPLIAAFVMIAAAYCLNSGCIASRNATALAAIVCIIGPPCMFGNTALLNFRARSGRVRAIAPRGPRSVLCVVLVTISA